MGQQSLVDEFGQGLEVRRDDLHQIIHFTGQRMCLQHIRQRTDQARKQFRIIRIVGRQCHGDDCNQRESGLIAIDDRVVALDQPRFFPIAFDDANIVTLTSGLCLPIRCLSAFHLVATLQEFFGQMYQFRDFRACLVGNLHGLNKQLAVFAIATSLKAVEATGSGTWPARSI